MATTAATPAPATLVLTRRIPYLGTAATSDTRCNARTTTIWKA
jgi:hypothetical protein